jgi:hypothetical protein
LGISLEAQPKTGAWQQVKAENQVATGQIDGNRENVNDSPALAGGEAAAAGRFSNW